MHLDTALSIADLAAAARRRLPASIHGYVSGGSEDQASLEGNRAAFARWRFVPRMLVEALAVGGAFRRHARLAGGDRADGRIGPVLL